MIDSKAFRTLSYGLYIVTSKLSDGRDAGCIINTMVQVSSHPAYVSISINKENVTTQAILDSKGYCVSVLSQDATMELIGRFGFRSSLEIEKLDGVASVEMDGMRCVTESCLAGFRVELDHTVDVGTHVLCVGRVTEAQVFDVEGKPLTYAYYHEHLKGKTPPKAASFSCEEEVAKAKGSPFPESQVICEDKMPKGEVPKGEVRYGWRCTLCGHIVEMDELPDDFKCPLCGMDKSYFERIELD